MYDLIVKLKGRYSNDVYNERIIIMKKSIIALSLILVLMSAFTITAYATSASYNKVIATMPMNTAVATGTKSNTTQSATNNITSTTNGDAVEFWIDGTAGRATPYYTTKAAYTTLKYSVFTPTVGTATKLKTTTTKVYIAAFTVVGNVNFN